MKKFLALILTVILSLSAMALVGCQPKQEESYTNIAVSNNGFMTENKTYDMPKTMAFSAKALSESVSGSLSITLQAHVYPDNAPNKLVDWVVLWADAENTNNVTEYVNVIPESDGSTIATVTCYKAFEGDIHVSVITREGLHTATCVVKFEGKPSSITVSGTGVSNGTGSFGDYINLGSGNTYNFNITPSNVFGVVGAACNYEITVNAVGSIITKDQWYFTGNDTKKWIDGTEQTIQLSSITKISRYYPTLYDISISENTLTIKMNATLEDYYVSSNRNSTYIEYDDRFFAYTDDNWYYEVIVTETNFGLSDSFKFRPIQSTTSVSLNEVTYTF